MYDDKSLTSISPNDLPCEIDKNVPLKKSDFDVMKLGMSEDEVESIVGYPNKLIGSGLHTVGYELEDGTVLILLYVPGENHIEVLSSMSLVNQDGSITNMFTE
jgi:hypothetical protein